MPIAIPAADLEFLREVRRLGLSGMNQDEIATALGLSRNGLRYRLQSIGFELMAASDVRATLTRERLADMLERGDLVAAEVAEVTA